MTLRPKYREKEGNTRSNYDEEGREEPTLAIRQKRREKKARIRREADMARTRWTAKRKALR